MKKTKTVIRMTKKNVQVNAALCTVVRDLLIVKRMMTEKNAKSAKTNVIRLRIIVGQTQNVQFILNIVLLNVIS